MLPAEQEILDKPLDEAVFSFLDVETTGLSPRSARVCEVAAVSFRGAERLGTLAELVNPGGPIPPACSAIHGITDEMVRDSPSFGAVAPRLLAMLENTVIVGHNADFDIRFLRAEFERVGLKFPGLPVVDTLAIARKNWKFQSNSLGSIAAELSISSEGWHRALTDVETTRKVFEHFIGAFRSAGTVTVGELWKKCGGKTS
ncbi:MAG: DNA polymerase III subunit epsilon [Elusimicrobia bacterium]|nr:MAG: DNA polymerase III subunit epsilon [Elusimicrobiota bacterium]KAF0158140.1 MAG: DNA polymerase III subunit epsilon [Elusimicrobiota bacterium]